MLRSGGSPFVVGTLFVGLAMMLGSSPGAISESAGAWLHTVARAQEDPVAVLVGAGDIGYCSSRNDERTARLLDAIDGIVFTTGDNAYPNASDLDFAECYAPSWGRHRERTRPSPGNHDYRHGGEAYHRYFGANAGPPGKGYYSYDLGGWHVVVLNSALSGTAVAEEIVWLEKDLNSKAGDCLLGYWHHPLFGSGIHSSPAAVQTFWQLLQEHGAELVINGHDHIYERFARQTADGELDEHGIREFIVGTAGGDLHPIDHVAPLSEARNDQTHGVLRLRLYGDHYDWDFVSVSKGEFTDTGSDRCTSRPSSPPGASR